MLRRRRFLVLTLVAAAATLTLRAAAPAPPDLDQRELTVRDRLVHRSGLGLGAGDLLWWPPSTYDRKEIVRRLRFIPPATSFRSAYAYDNVFDFHDLLLKPAHR